MLYSSRKVPGTSTFTSCPVPKRELREELLELLELCCWRRSCCCLLCSSSLSCSCLCCSTLSCSSLNCSCLCCSILSCSSLSCSCLCCWKQTTVLLSSPSPTLKVANSGNPV